MSGTRRADRAAEDRVEKLFAQAGRGILHWDLKTIAEKCGVSRATVVRWCAHAGFSGLKDYKIALAARAQEPSPLRDGDSHALIRDKVFAGCVDALKTTRESLSEDDLKKAVDLIAGAGHLDVYAVGGSAPVAGYLRHQFIKLGIRVSVYSDRASLLMSSRGLTEGDTVLAISSSGTTPEVLEALIRARASGARAIALTGSPASPLAEAADVTLPALGESFLDNSTYSRLSQLAVVDLMYAALRMDRPGGAFEER